MKAFGNYLLVLTMTLAVGCGGQVVVTPKPARMETTDAADLKARLEIFVQTGIVGSAVVGMKEAIQKLPADKSGPLLEDFDKLNAATSPAKIKEIAKRMAEKL